MKSPFTPAILPALAVVCLTSVDSAPAQGSLTPPGAPGPTMVTLQQIEPRIPISSGAYITNSGSYYLTGNITVTSRSPIEIQANDVTLDLNGFTIATTTGTISGTGISILSGTNISIFNGHISGNGSNNGASYVGGGFAYGIYYSSTPYNVHVSRVTVSGCADDGINLNTDNASVVEDCAVNSVGGNGIVADNVAHSVANLCGLTAIYGNVVQNCYGYATGSGSGVVAFATALNCYGYCTGNGTAFASGDAENCYAICGGSGSGLYVDNTALNCYGYSYGYDGLDATTAEGCSGGSGGSGDGINAVNVANCNGTANTGDGIYASGTVHNSNGTCNSTDNEGVICFGNAENTSGYNSTGDGMYVATGALNCAGTSGGSTASGLTVGNIAIGCYGSGAAGLSSYIAQSCYGNCTTATGTGLSATIGNSCQGVGGAHPVTVTYKYNMP